jgi:hypothetical protein
MKEIYKDLLTKLSAISELKWVDLNKGQMNFERPPVTFPAVLIGLALPQCSDLNHLKQNVILQIRLKVCFDFSGNTNKLTPTANQDTALAYFDTVDAIHTALQGKRLTNTNFLSRTNVTEEIRPDGYKVVNTTYQTDYNEV